MEGCCRSAAGHRPVAPCWSASIDAHGAACWGCSSCMLPVQLQCLPQLHQKPSDAVCIAQLPPTSRHSCGPAPMPCALCLPLPLPYALHAVAHLSITPVTSPSARFAGGAHLCLPDCFQKPNICPAEMHSSGHTVLDCFLLVTPFSLRSPGIMTFTWGTRAGCSCSKSK